MHLASSSTSHLHAHSSSLLSSSFPILSFPVCCPRYHILPFLHSIQFNSIPFHSFTVMCACDLFDCRVAFQIISTLLCQSLSPTTLSNPSLDRENYMFGNVAGQFISDDVKKKETIVLEGAVNMVFHVCRLCRS